MLIFNENNKAVILDSIFTPIPSSHFWVLDLDMMDFTLTSLSILEEITCPTVGLQVDGYVFYLPAHWYILIHDQETGQVDLVQLSHAAGDAFTAVVYGHDCNMIKSQHIRIVDYQPARQHVNPSLNKHQMLCHPISATLWINISPTDSYNKYLKDLTVGELI